MLEALFAAAAEAVFSYILDTLEPAERLRDWLKRNPAKLAYQHALARTYAAFARQYPELTTSLFNDSFLTIEAAPELAKFLTPNQHPDHTELVCLWAKSIAPQTEADQQSIEALSKREDLNAASAYFVELLTSELKHESALQPLFDSRALESLPTIEAKLDQLTNALKQAMTVANNYEQTVVNRSGGVDLQAQDVTIGGDVVGRDKIVSNTFNTYFTGDFATLDDLYVRPNAVFQRVRVQDFVGREWLTAKVDAFLNDEKRKSGVFLLVGEAGVGKTSFMAHLVSERRYLHLFAEQIPGDVNVSRALQSLGAQLVARYQIDPYKEKGTLPAIATFPDFLDKLLRLAAEKLSAGEKIVIVCDALDEAGTAPNGNVFGLPSVLPDGVYFILSQRPVTVKLSVKADLVKEIIDAAGADNLNDVEQYLTAVSRRFEVSNQLRAHNYTEVDFVRILKERSGGMWMYLFYVVSEIAVGSRAPLDLATLPSGLAGYYTDYWGDWCEGRRGRGDGPAKWDDVYAPLLATLAAAQLPISLRLLLAWAQVQATAYEVERLLRRNWRAFIIEREIDHTPHFALYHASLRDFLTGQVDRQTLTLEAEQLIDELAHRTRDAHARIIEYYRKRCNGDWVKIVDDDYARIHLCLHLSVSGDDETMYQLVAMSNAWAEARYAKEESYAGYLVDLDRAWQWAESETQWNVGKQIRCALIEGSIRSLAGNLQPELLKQLVGTGMWKPMQAWAHVLQIPDDMVRAEAIEKLAPLLPDVLKTEALMTTRTIADEEARAIALARLAGVLPNDMQREALAAVREIQDEHVRAVTLSGLAGALPNELKREVLAAIREIENEPARVEAFCGLTGVLPLDLLIKAFAIAWDIGMEEERYLALDRLSGVPPDELENFALEAARVIWDVPVRCLEFISRAVVLPDDLRCEAMREALAGWGGTDIPARIRAFSELANVLPDPLKIAAWRKALAAAQEIESDDDRMEALSGLVGALPYEFRRKVAREALAEARAITWDKSTRVLALSRLAVALPDTMKRKVWYEALTVAREIDWGPSRVDALSGLATVLPDKLQRQALHEALVVAWVIADVPERTLALSELADALPAGLRSAVVREVWVVAKELESESDRAEAIYRLANVLPRDLQREALAAAMKIEHAYARAQALMGLAGALPKKEKSKARHEALAAAREINEEIYRAEALGQLATVLPGNLKRRAARDALVAASAIKDESARALAMSNLAGVLPSDLKSKALATVRAVGSEFARAMALSVMADVLPEELRREALAAALEIESEPDRVIALSGWIRDLPEELRRRTVREALSEARTGWDSDRRARILCRLAEFLPDELKREALEAVTQEISPMPDWDEPGQARALIGLASVLPDELKHEALVAAQKIKDKSARAEALRELAADWSKESGRPSNYRFIWIETLHLLAAKRRAELLTDLSALKTLIAHWGDRAAVVEIVYAIRDVTQWWP
jgi:hypothetical protein